MEQDRKGVIMRYIPELTEKDIAENRKYFQERVTLYKSLGIDFANIRKSILKKAGTLEKDILEIGSGNGYTALSLAKQGHKVISVDPDKEALRKTALNLAYERLLGKVELYLMDGKSLKFDNQSFQAVIVINLFHHIEDVDNVLSEIDRVLCAGGKLIAADFNKQGMKIINSVHKNEGRTHEDSGVTKEHSYFYFNKLGYNITEPKNRYHWILIAEKKIQP